MKSVIEKKTVIKNNNKPIVIVSGLPRSGTSMMMQMLETGGMPIVSDNIRKPDEDNPRGYYELEIVKKIKEDNSWLDNCYGMAFKMVSALLFYLPGFNRYKVIFMERKMQEMIASQNVMLQRHGLKNDSASDEVMTKKMENHLFKIKQWLVKQDNIDVIYIKFNEAIRSPQLHAEHINQFLGDHLDVGKMKAAVVGKLYRQKS